MEGVKDDIHQMREDLRRYNDDKVSRNEWTQRNEHVDAMIRDLAKEIANARVDMAADISELKQENASKKVPWTSVAVAVVAVATIALTLMMNLPTGG